ncbi:MAG: hypothetical protein J0L84_18535 [Verrucomicrobia bacterium]|nr:hypothetical protein [Verrucomicrobiota bacterium]
MRLLHTSRWVAVSPAGLSLLAVGCALHLLALPGFEAGEGLAVHAVVERRVLELPGLPPDYRTASCWTNSFKPRSATEAC